MNQKKGTTVQETARVAESSILAISKNEVEIYTKERRKGPRKAPAAIDTHGFKVNGLVWQTAQELLATGTYTEIEILSPIEVRVR